MRKYKQNAHLLKLKNIAIKLGATGAKIIKTKDIVFEKEKVFVKCITCQHFNKKPCCPPFDIKINYKKLIKSYDFGILVWIREEFNKDTFSLIRKESTITLQKLLLQLEKEAFNLNLCFAVSFIGGSCKLCPDGCPPTKICINPTDSRLPLESVGVNVIKTCRKIGLKLAPFPVKDHLYRVGLLLA
ncbi:DUF2284 domain-containing protein [Candidatus Woesearchaeota archaeon]|nr:DUF2284 domain-containing protein [Candidatus Woesearchaeota archaeon]